MLKRLLIAFCVFVFTFSTVACASQSESSKESDYSSVGSESAFESESFESIFTSESESYESVSESEIQESESEREEENQSPNGGESESDSEFVGESSGESTEGGQKPETPPSATDKEMAYAFYPEINEKMPAVYINTTDGSNSWATQYSAWNKNSIEYVDATVSVGNCEEVYSFSNAKAEVKVRGNATLNYSKKPIRIKFAKKEKKNMLGLNGEREFRNWVLLADWKDFSLSNNFLAFYLGNTILGSDGYYCTDFINVEVYLNGEYWGVYLLVE